MKRDATEQEQKIMMSVASDIFSKLLMESHIILSEREINLITLNAAAVGIARFLSVFIKGTLDDKNSQLMLLDKINTIALNDINNPCDPTND